MPSFYIDFNLNTPETEVFDDEFHHIANVFRHKKGDLLSLINGKGLKAKGLIEDIKKKSLVLKISDSVHIKKPEFKVACAFSLLKNKHDLMIVEKLTELGVDDLFPMQTKYSVKLSRENTIEKMKKTAISAAKQCDNAWLPEIHEVFDLEDVFEALKDMDYAPIVASENIPDVSLCDFVKGRGHLRCPAYHLSEKEIEDVQNISGYCVLIGPEGGFDKSEFELFEKKSIPQVAISRNVLRAETAAICAISQIFGTLLMDNFRSANLRLA